VRLTVYRRLFAIFVVACALISNAPSVIYAQREPDWAVTQDRKEFVYFASKNSNKYHRAGCQYVSRIKPGNLVGFRSAGEAVQMGYVPCKVCRPPTGDAQ